MWADNETSEDLLGFKVHADLLIDVINDDAVLPVTIGVFGDWGSGKSSILKIIYEELKGEEDLKNGTLVLYFNGWIFEGYDDAKAALLESIIKAFEENKTLYEKVKGKTTKLLQSVNWMRILGLGFKKVAIPAATAYFTGGISLIPHLANELKGIDPAKLAEKLNGEGSEEFLGSLLKDVPKQDETTLIRDFRDDFKELIDASSINKLVVIIDDLDRCTPERIIENLEAIKLFLNVEQTAFLIGADPRIVKHAIEYRYKTRGEVTTSEEGNDRIVNDYLEKLIQIPYNLPKLSDSEVETYLTLLFCKREFGDEFCNVVDSFKQHRGKDRYSVFGLGNLTPEQRSNLTDTVSLIASLAPIITEGLNGNPRQIKRFLNSFELRRRLAVIAKIPDFKVDLLAKLMVLEYSYLNLFKRLHEWQSVKEGKPDQIGILEEIAKSDKDDNAKKDEIKVSYPDWSSDKLLRWLKVEPSLIDVDLRDYYWISRDQLSNSISGVSLIPGHIRSLYKNLLDAGSGSIQKRKVTQEVKQGLNEIELQQLFNLLEKEIIKEPSKDILHKLFIEIMAQQVSGSIQRYIALLQTINHDLIPFNLRNDFREALRSNPEIQNIINSFSNESQIGRGLSNL